jgi:hypothetical protein
MQAISRSFLFVTLSLGLGVGLTACGGMNQQEPPDGGSNHPETCGAGSNACDTCGDESCCTELQACEDNASCQSEVDCAAACGSDTACINNCANEYSAGVEDANALGNCLEANCSEACAPPPADVSPIGTWTMDVDYGVNTCGGAAAYFTETFTVSQGPNGYLVAAGNDTVSGTTSCTPSGCTTSLVLGWTTNGTAYQQTLNLSLGSNGSIYGSASETWDSCSASATVTGSKD